MVCPDARAANISACIDAGACTSVVVRGALDVVAAFFGADVLVAAFFVAAFFGADFFVAAFFGAAFFVADFCFDVDFVDGVVAFSAVALAFGASFVAVEAALVDDFDRADTARAARGLPTVPTVDERV